MTSGFTVKDSTLNIIIKSVAIAAYQLDLNRYQNLNQHNFKNFYLNFFLIKKCLNQLFEFLLVIFHGKFVKHHCLRIIFVEMRDENIIILCTKKMYTYILEFSDLDLGGFVAHC